MRIVSAERESSAVVQRDRYGVEARNVVKPAAGRQMNSPAIPPTDTNGLTSDNIRKPNFPADNARSK